MVLRCGWCWLATLHVAARRFHGLGLVGWMGMPHVLLVTFILPLPSVLLRVDELVVVPLPLGFFDYCNQPVMLFLTVCLSCCQYTYRWPGGSG